MAIVGAGAFAGLAVGVNKAIQEAGNAEKISQNFENTFGDSADTINSFIADFGSQFAFVESEMRDGANSIGFQLNAMGGIGKEASEEITTSLLTAAGGLSDFFGEQVNVTQAANAMAKGLAGNRQQLIDMGFNVLEEDIKAAAAAMGMNTDELTKAQEAQVFTKLIMDQTQGSVAGLNESMDSYTGQQRALRKATKETSQTLGEVFLPLATDIIKQIQPVVTSIANWVRENQELTKKIILVTGAIAGIVAVVGTLGLVILPLISAFKVVAVVIAALASPIGIIIGLLAVIGTSIAYIALNWAQHWDNIKWAVGKAVDWISEKLNGAKSILAGFGNFFIGIAEGIANSWVRAVNTIIKALNTIRVSVPDWVPGIGGKSFGIDLPTIPKIEIPRLAEGGIVTRPTIAEIGEAGPEAVVPLRGNNAMGDTHVHINVDGREMARVVLDRLTGDIKQNVRV